MSFALTNILTPNAPASIPNSYAPSDTNSFLNALGIGSSSSTAPTLDANGNVISTPSAAGSSGITGSLGQIGSFFQTLQNFLTTKASDYAARGGIEILGAIFLIVGFVMLINRTSAQGAVDRVGAAIST